MIRIKSILTCLFLFVICTSYAQEKWTDLFNGKDLTGWKMSDDNTLVDELTAEILDYLERNPGAADTLAGIATYLEARLEWSLRRRAYRRRRGEE